ncbi:MAG: glycosyltransferase [Candidatus Saccharimonadales bacterium]
MINNIPKHPTVSIIVPCYNLGNFIDDAVDSIKQQTYKNIEIIIIDDGSTDEQTLIKIEEYKKDKSINVIQQTNQGLSTTRNNGIAAAKGEYIVCLDSDDRLDKNFVEKCINKFDENSTGNVGIVTTWLKEFGLRNNIWKTSDYDVVKLLETNILHAASMFKKSAWQKVGGYKKEMVGGYEDWEFWLSMVESGYEWMCIREPLFYYRIREGSMLSISRQNHIELYHRLYEFHRPLFDKYTDDHNLHLISEIQDLRKQIANKDALLEQHVHTKKDADEILIAANELREKLFQLSDELSDYKSSPVVSGAIKTHKAIRKTYHLSKKAFIKLRRAPRKALRISRNIIAPHVPEKARKKIMNKYRHERDKRKKHPSYMEVNNIPWDKNKPLISVVIPYYNLGETIIDTIESLHRQTYRDFETILVNDGSNDLKSLEKLDELKSNNSLKIQFIDQNNSGVAAARNNGIQHASGKYIICLDADDMLMPTYIEKSLITLESHPDIALFSSDMEIFGVMAQRESKGVYDPISLIDDNRIITAACFTKESWEVVGGYKSDIGYEDWEYWINLAEHGYWGKILPEAIFKYRTALKSRYIDDKSKHIMNIKSLRQLHPRYKQKIKKLQKNRNSINKVINSKNAFVNLSESKSYRITDTKTPILQLLPWMTFGGAETLIYNFSRELEKKYDISYITGLQSTHEWEWKFREITDKIYHTANMFDDNKLVLEFISNYIRTRNIKLIHIVHTSFGMDLLEELKNRHPDIKVLVTMFNDRAEHFELSVKMQKYIDSFSTDNLNVVNHYKEVLSPEKMITRIPNGINCEQDYNPELFNRHEERKKLGINDDDTAVFFAGRLSEEKNPDVFIRAAEKVIRNNKNNHKKIKFFVIGDGVMRSFVEDMITDIKSSDIKYLGYQSYVAPYLSAGDVFVLPSSIEGFPLSILEAMAMEMVVIASDVGAVSEIIENERDGFVVRPGDVTEISKRIQYIIDNKPQADLLKRNARKAIKDVYSQELLGENYRNLYDQSINDTTKRSGS